jgi:hypothetical protein
VLDGSGAWVRGDVGPVTDVDGDGAAYVDLGYASVTVLDPRADAFVVFGLASMDMNTLFRTPGRYDVAGDDAYAWACTTNERSVDHFDEGATNGAITVDPVAPPENNGDPPDGTVTVHVDVGGPAHRVSVALRVPAPVVE